VLGAIGAAVQLTLRHRRKQRTIRARVGRISEAFGRMFRKPAEIVPIRRLDGLGLRPRHRLAVDDDAESATARGQLVQAGSRPDETAECEARLAPAGPRVLCERSGRRERRGRKERRVVEQALQERDPCV
jgi:hypothetical protein